MKNENPCENCIVKAICLTPCDELSNFATKIINPKNLMSTTWYNCWLKNYERRPRIIELYKIKES